MSVRRRIGAPVTWILGPTFRSQYLPALRARGHGVPYDPARAWTDRYARVLEESGLDDMATVKRRANPQLIRYHYNAVENALLEHLLRHPLAEQPSVLDIGVGAGHWVDFYRSALGAGNVVGLEISAPAVEALRATYAAAGDVTLLEADVGGEQFRLDMSFDVINAVDVLFHIVDERRWRRALRNIADHLAPRGRLVVAECVGLVSHDAGFRRPDTARGDADSRPDAGRYVVTKRVRSLRHWREGAAAAGLELSDTIRLRKRRSLSTPANRLMVFRRRSQE
jgi:SAM-dependent methyltransferase